MSNDSRAAPRRPKGLIAAFLFLGLATLLFVWIADVDRDYERGYPPFDQVVEIPPARIRIAQIDLPHALEAHGVYLRTHPCVATAADIVGHVRVEVLDAYEEGAGFQSCTSFSEHDDRKGWTQIGHFFGHGQAVRIQVALDEKYAWPARVKVAVTEHYLVDKGWWIGQGLWIDYERPFFLVVAFLFAFAGARRLVLARICLRPMDSTSHAPGIHAAGSVE